MVAIDGLTDCRTYCSDRHLMATTNPKLRQTFMLLQASLVLSLAVLVHASECGVPSGPLSSA